MSRSRSARYSSLNSSTSSCPSFFPGRNWYNSRAVEWWESLRKSAGDAYGRMLEADVAREIGEIGLPVSTYTPGYWKIRPAQPPARCHLRVDRRAQWEIREFAGVIAPVAKRVAALTCEAWVDYGLKSRWLDVGGARRAGAAAGATGGGDRRA